MINSSIEKPIEACRNITTSVEVIERLEFFQSDFIRVMDNKRSFGGNSIEESVSRA